MPEYAGGLHAPQCKSSVPPAAGAACGAPRVPGTGGTCPYPSGYYECVYQDKTLCLANTSKDEARFEYQLVLMRKLSFPTFYTENDPFAKTG